MSSRKAPKPVHVVVDVCIRRFVSSQVMPVVVIGPSAWDSIHGAMVEMRIQIDGFQSIDSDYEYYRN